MRVAIVGYGSIGNRHARNLRALGVRDLIVVRRAAGQNDAFSVEEGVRVVHSVSEAIGLEPTFAIVCNPSAMHVDSALPFVRARIPVLIEKPLAATRASAAALVDEANKGASLAAMAYCMRYHGAYAAAREALVAGRIGRVLYANAWFESYLPAWHPWEEYSKSYAARREMGGGALRTLDHEIDFMNWCLGEPLATTGSAVVTGALDMDADDFATVVSTHPQNVVSCIRLALCRRDRTRGFEFVGVDGTLSWELRTGELRLARANSEVSETLAVFDGAEIDNMYLRLIEDMVSSVREGRLAKKLASITAGLETLKVIERIPVTPYGAEAS